MRGTGQALALCLMAVVGTAHAANNDQVVSWVDSDGVTHFGDPSFAPSGATEVAVAPANGMDVPTVVPGNNSRGAVWTVIEQAPKQNKVGWRSKGQRPPNGHIRPSQR